MKTRDERIQIFEARVIHSFRHVYFISDGDAEPLWPPITDWVKVGQSYTNNEGNSSVSGEKGSLLKNESDRHATRNTGRQQRRAVDFFDFNEDSTVRKRSLSPSDDSDSGREAKTRQHKPGEDCFLI